MACGQLREKSEFQRCSKCLDVYYCSRQCQTIDWRAGHRLTCLQFSGVGKLPEEQQCSKQDRAFMRALIHREYLAHRHQIFAAEISVLKQNPQQQTLVCFDYMDGPVVVNVVPWPSPTSLLEEAMPYDWVARHYNHGYRAAASAGRITVHMMNIPSGMKYHYKIFPLRHTGDPGMEIRNYLWAITQKVAHIDITDPRTYDSLVGEELKPSLAMDLPCIHE
ncbi:hypothetical protein FB451DRAFT_1162426 [Mycena latifolia]|nr:hypothetical protein FB451DRAFT_1162426 [Mycena latifolia]